MDVGEDESDGKTIGYYDWNETEIAVPTQGRKSVGGPVVGWVVATDGLHKGQDFPLKAGKNFIGRSEDMDISLEDKTISRDRHAVIVYDPKSNVFLVAPGDARELFYLNGEVVLATQQIKAYDVISLGKTQLTFVPFCNDTFSWEPKEEKE
jgi:pSer/pThr/pTyr-binding forkhead associated (FHA) protein